MGHGAWWNGTASRAPVVDVPCGGSKDDEAHAEQKVAREGEGALDEPVAHGRRVAPVPLEVRGDGAPVRDDALLAEDLGRREAPAQRLACAV